MTAKISEDGYLCENNKKYSHKKDSVEEYMITIIENHIKNNNVKKRFKQKINSEIIEIPSFSQYNLFLETNYNVSQLKNIAKIRLVSKLNKILKLIFTNKKTG